MWKIFSKNKPAEHQIRETKRIRKHFDFLFEHGFSIINAEPAKHFNNWLLDLKSETLRIQFSEDRSELIILIGIKEATTGWQGSPLWHLQTLVFHITDDFNSIPRWFYTKKMKEAAKIFKAHFEQISTIFLNNDYQALENDLKKSQGILIRKWDPEIEKPLGQIR